MTTTYVHLPQEEDIGPEGRSYSITENVINHNGRELFFLYVLASEISFCDRNYAPHIANINVKGYVVKWKYISNEKGETISEIDQINDSADRRTITDFLHTNYSVSTINFI